MATALERHVVGRRAGAAALLARGLGRLPGQIAPYWPQALRQEIPLKDFPHAGGEAPRAARPGPGRYRKPNSRAGVSQSTVRRSAGSGSQRWRQTSGGP